MDHNERVLRGRIGKYTVHSRYDGHELTAPARRALEGKVERDVDADGVVPIEERLRRADAAREAHYARGRATVIRS